MQRQAYHTSLKELAHYGLLPPKYQKKIPRTNLHRWRKDAFDRYLGSEINQIADKHTELIKVLNEYPKMFYAYGRLIKTVINIVEKSNDFSKLVRESKKQVIETIYRVKDIVPINKAIKIFKISSSTLNVWKKDIEHFCSMSFFNHCNRIYPKSNYSYRNSESQKSTLKPCYFPLEY